MPRRVFISRNSSKYNACTSERNEIETNKYEKRIIWIVTGTHRIVIEMQRFHT